MKIGIPKKILRLGKIKENKKAFFAIFASIIMVATIGTYVVFYPHGTTHEGVPVNFSVKITGSIPGVSPYVAGTNNTYVNSSYVHVAITSVVPSGINDTMRGNIVNMSAMNLSNNPYVISIFSGKISKSNSQIFLGNNFFSLGKEWRMQNISNQSSVSLQVEAAYSIQYNGYVYGYNYFNNILYSPFSSVFNTPASFVTSSISPQMSLANNIVFNLSHPSFRYKINMTDLKNGIGGKILNEVSASMQPDRIIGGGGSGASGIGGNGNCDLPPIGLCGPECAANATYYPLDRLNKEKSWTGILPLAFAQLKSPQDSESNFIYSFMSTTTGTNYQFNSAQACENASTYGKVRDSTVASFNNGYAGDITGNGESYNNPLSNTSMIYMTNVSFTLENYQVLYPTPILINEEWYCTVVYGPNVISIKVDSTGNNGTDPSKIETNALSILAANTVNQSQTAIMWASVLNSFGFEKLNTTYMNPGAECSNFNYASSTKEYNNAASKMKQINSAVGTFTAMLGVALAINAAISIIPGAGSADDVVNGISIADASVGLTSSIIGDMSSISMEFISHSNLYGFILTNERGPNNQGTPLNVVSYSSASQSFFIDSNGNAYLFYTPSYYFSAEPT